MANPFPVPLNALRAIDIVARTQALAPAAAELGVTVGAVSQHIRRAEERLGVMLFERTASGLKPTPALLEVVPLLASGFTALAEAGRVLRGEAECILTVTVGNVFASRWLVWRLGRFTEAHPEIELRMVTTGKLMDLARSDIDCAIRYGRGGWPGVLAEPLGANVVNPVCAPALAARIRRPEDIGSVPVIADQSSMLSWPDWFSAAGATMPALSGPTYSDPALAFDAAISGQGVLLAVDLMAADAVSDGRLVRPLPVKMQVELDYWLAVSDSRREPKKVTAFRHWLREEIPRSVNGYAAG